MATLELDPLFVKALRLLHSKAKDSAEQLRQMLDDVLTQQKHANKETKMLFAAVKQESENMKLLSMSRKASPKHPSDFQTHGKKHLSASTADDLRKPKEVEKRPLEKLRLERSTESSHESAVKKARLDSPQALRSSSSSPQPCRTDDSSSRVDGDSDSTEGNADADNFAMEMGLACIVCKQIDVSPGNQLVECQECHNLYHQECHRPPATDHDFNDPRQVWYCTRCTKNMKKLATKPQKTSKVIGSSLVGKEISSQVKMAKPDPSPPTLLQPFKRAEIKVPALQSNSSSSSGGNTPNKPTGLAGLAGLAANFSQGRSTSTTGAIGKTSSPGPFGSKPGLPPTSKPAGAFASLSLLKNLSSASSSSASVESKASSYSGSSSGGTSKPSMLSMSGVPKTSSASVSMAMSRGGASAGSNGGSSGSSLGISGSGGSGAKPASSSSLMSADKRLQIMKKKAAKMQEKRRLSAK